MTNDWPPMTTIPCSVRIAGVAAILLVTSASARAQTSGLLAILDPGKASANTLSGRTAFSWHPLSNVTGQEEDFGYNRTDLQISLSLPVAEKTRISTGLNASTLQVDTRASFPDSGLRFPPALWRVHGNIGGSVPLGSGALLGGFLGFGTSADRPFFSNRELTFSSLFFLRLPQGERDAWILALFFGTSGAELTSIPIPVLAYLWRPHKRFQALAGLPFLFLMANPVASLRIIFSYFPITNVNLRASARLGPFTFSAGWTVKSDAFRVVEEEDDRVFHYCSRVTAGVSVPLFFHRAGEDAEGGEHATEGGEGKAKKPARFAFAALTLQGGWDFLRFSFAGEGIQDWREDRFDIADGGFLSAGIRFAF